MEAKRGFTSKDSHILHTDLPAKAHSLLWSIWNTLIFLMILLSVPKMVDNTLHNQSVTPIIPLTSTIDPSHSTLCTTTGKYKSLFETSTHSYVQLSTEILSSAGVAPNSTQILSVIKCDETLAAASSTFEPFCEILLTSPTFDATLTCKTPTNDSTSTYKTSGDIFMASNTQIKFCYNM
eukprot:169960_1